MRHVPRFSIVMPAFNAAKTLHASVGSVMAQDFESWELIIVDDGSTDDTREICCRFASIDARVQVHTQLNAGAGAAIGAAVQRASGEFIVQLGADDELLSDYCSKTHAFIERMPGYDIYASNAYYLLPDGRRRLYHTEPRFRRVMSLSVDDLLDAPLIYGTAAFRREWFWKVGGFRAEHYNEDYDFWLRIMIAGARHIYQPVPLAIYRVREGQKTSDGIRARESDIAILKEAIAGGGLTPEQVEHAMRTIALLERNVAFRRAALRLLGEGLSQPLFVAAHRLAWFVRPYRRVR